MKPQKRKITDIIADYEAYFLHYNVYLQEILRGTGAIYLSKKSVVIAFEDLLEVKNKIENIIFDKKLQNNKFFSINWNPYTYMWSDELGLFSGCMKISLRKVKNSIQKDKIILRADSEEYREIDILNILFKPKFNALQSEC